MDNAFERARLIAAKLAANGGSAGARPQGGSGESTLGKRKSPYDSGGPSLRVERIYLPVRQHPDVKFQGLIIGPGASTIKKLQADSGARIALRGKGSSKEARTNLTPEDMDELHVMVEGTDGQVARAKQDIQNISANLQQIKEAQLSALAGGSGGGGGGSHYGPPAGGSGMGTGTGTGGEYSEDIRVPSVHVGRLIGRGGDMSRRLQQDSGARMSIAKVGNPERIVTLSGTQESVQRLKAAIMSRLDEEDCRGNGGGGMGMGASHGGGSFYGGAGAAGALRAVSGQRGGGGGGGGQELDHPIVLKISLPHDKCGALIGRGGQTIRSLQEKTQCAIKVPSQPDPSNPSMRVVSVGAYSQEQADDAQAQIFAVIQEATQTRNDELAGQTQESYHLPDQFSGMVIGKGGSTIKALQSRCNCRVQIPNQCDPALQPPARLCTLVGTAKAIAAARNELDNIIAQGNMGYTTPQLDAYGAVQAVQAVAPNANPYGASGMYGAAPSPYGAPMAAAGGAGYYGASMAPPMAPPMAAVGYYGAYGGATSTLPSSDQTYAQAAAPPAAAAAEEDVEPEDDDAKVEYYHKKYWEYATYYGEKAAREFYGDWSPAAGTAPPAGVVPAADPVEAKEDHEATAGETQDVGTSVESNEEKKDDVEAKAEADADAGAEAEAETGAEDDKNDSGEGGAEGGGEGEDAPLSAEEERAHADEVAAYKAQYREWWLFHGKAAGAPEEPPEQ